MIHFGLISLFIIYLIIRYCIFRYCFITFHTYRFLIILSIDEVYEVRNRRYKDGLFDVSWGQDA